MSVHNWRHERPKRFYPKAIRLLGKPTFTANKPHGMAYWKKTHGLFDEHTLRDQEVPHCAPAHHHDFFYSSIRCFVPPDKRLAVLSISGSINYDGLTNLLTARCASIEANIATLYLGMCVANGVMSIEEVKRKGLYARHIRGEAETYGEMRKKMMRMKRDNHRRNKRQLDADFDPLAFSRCA